MTVKFPCCLRVITFILLSSLAAATEKNGFSLDNSLVPVREILRGGPPRDGIPALDNPNMLSIQKSKLKAQQRVLGLSIDGEARAYPINILNWHEIVNDTINHQAIVISYCPLCGSGMAFLSDKKGFGVSGLLYNSDVLLYDRRTESLWSQIAMRAIAGPKVGEKLPAIPLEHTTWLDWKTRYPNTQVLSESTGYKRNYARSPYAGYEKTRDLYFKVSHQAPRRLHPKALVLGVVNGTGSKAYPYQTLEKNKQKIIHDRIGNQTITILWDKESQSARLATTPADIVAVQLYWFAWYTFHPDTEVFTANN